jgi:hypothetical protein
MHLNLSWEFMRRASVGLNVHNVFNQMLADGHLDQSSLASLQANGSVNGLPSAPAGGQWARRRARPELRVLSPQRAKVRLVTCKTT